MAAGYKLEVLPVESALLRGNPLGDPTRRELVLLTPEGVDPKQALPVIWMIPGFGGSQGGFLSSDPWREGLQQRLNRLADAGLPPVLVALPDLFTRFGGSQALDSPATGAYESHLWEELRPLVERHRSISAHGICGHSSGGFAALVQAMKHPDIISACAAHAPDMLFELSCLPDFPKAAARIRAEGGVERFLAAFDAAVKKQDGRWLTAINVVCMAACYSPDRDSPAGLALPFDLDTCELRPEIWDRWLRNDPLRLLDAPASAAALRRLRLLFIDAGTRDEWNLQWGARAFVRKLKTLGIPCQHEEFDDGHMGTAYRYDRSIPLLAAALSVKVG
jgi:enterochelin esterase family protein